MLIVSRNTRIKAIDYVIDPRFYFFPIAAVVGLNTGESAIGLELTDTDFMGY